MRRVLFWLGGACLTLVLIVLALGGAAYQASRHVPDFYAEALAATPVQRAEQADSPLRGVEQAEPPPLVVEQARHFEEQVRELEKSTRAEGRWQATFSEQEINGWLAYELPRKFASRLPGEVRAPRVAIEPGLLQVACKYEGPRVSTVVWLALEPRLTDQPNQLALRVRKARAGALPLPLGSWLEQIGEAARQADMPVEWTKEEGDMVLLVDIPARHPEYVHREVRVESLELRDGAIHLEGATVDDERRSEPGDP